jgi:hypothetical protein
MEPHERTEMVDALLAEANQHLEILDSRWREIRSP